MTELLTDVVVDSDVVVHARDGARLTTDVYRPDGGGPHPSLVIRTPYGKTGIGERYRARWLASQGYSVVVQDVRGTSGSDGEFDRTFGDGEDGHDCVEWAAAQPWSTGRVGMFGASAMGGTQWACAETAPPHLVAIAPEVVSTGCTPRTAFPLEVNLMFAVAMAGFELETRKDEWDAAAYAERRRGLDAAMADPMTVLGRMPLADQPLLQGLAPFFDELLDDPAVYNLGAIDFGSITVPAFVVGGWYDFTLSGTLAQYAGMRTRAGSALAREASRLLVGPWYHGVEPEQHRDGWIPITVGANARTDVAFPAWLRWMRPFLLGEEPALPDGPSGAAEPRARVFTMNTGWQDLPDWPPADADVQEWYLHSAGDAGTAGGRLSTEPPADEPADSYVYDPADPVPTAGGGQGGVFDQRAVAARADVLVYRSDPLDAEVEVTGPVTVTLHAATSARDTDWTAMLTHVRPDGAVLNVAHGILRARYRAGLDPQLLTPGEVVEYRVDLEAVSYAFPAGHRIGLHVSSSNFPEFDRNTNTGGSIAREGEFVVAEQRVLHSAGQASRITLPVRAR